MSEPEIFSVVPTRAGDVKPGQTIWAQADRDWMTVHRTEVGEWDTELFRRDGSVAEFETGETVLRRAQ